MSRKKEVMYAVLTGVIALGIFAAAYSSTQMLNAVAQTGDEKQSVGSSDKELSVSANSYPEHSMTSTVSTSGSASTQVKPDRFSITLGVETNGTTAEEAADRNADLMDKVIAALRGLGISEEEISTSSYSVYPVYSVIKDVNSCRVMEGYPIPPECYSDQQVVGYRATNSITVTLETDGDIDAGRVIDTAVSAGATNVNGVYFFISQELQQETQDSLIKEAIASARHRAEIAADAVDMTLGRVHSIQLSDVYFPIFAGGFDAAKATPILPGEQQITSTVNVVFTLVSSNEENSTGFGQREAAMAFLEERLPELGITVNDTSDIRVDSTTQISDIEYDVDFSVTDSQGQVHSGHIKVVNGEVLVAQLDGKSIL